MKHPPTAWLPPVATDGLWVVGSAVDAYYTDQGNGASTDQEEPKPLCPGASEAIPVFHTTLLRRDADGSASCVKRCDHLLKYE